MYYAVFSSNAMYSKHVSNKFNIMYTGFKFKFVHISPPGFITCTWDFFTLLNNMSFQCPLHTFEFIFLWKQSRNDDLTSKRGGGGMVLFLNNILIPNLATKNMLWLRKKKRRLQLRPYRRRKKREKHFYLFCTLQNDVFLYF